jgi:hypothetical protein
VNTWILLFVKWSHACIRNRHSKRSLSWGKWLCLPWVKTLHIFIYIYTWIYEIMYWNNEIIYWNNEIIYFIISYILYFVNEILKYFIISYIFIYFIYEIIKRILFLILFYLIYYKLLSIILMLNNKETFFITIIIFFFLPWQTVMGSVCSVTDVTSDKPATRESPGRVWKGLTAKPKVKTERCFYEWARRARVG